jgi:uncharacterized protein (TIGR00251 family)
MQKTMTDKKPSPFRPHARGVTVAIRLTPKARHEDIDGTMPGEDDTVLLKASVNAPPEDGKANKALIALLAKEWKLPKSSLSLLSGDTSRQKVILMTGESEMLMQKLALWLEALSD